MPWRNRRLRLLVTGAEGQLARKLAAMSRPNVTIMAVGRPDLNVCHPATVDRAIGTFKPDIVINAAAYTAVDKAESESEAAFAVNRDGAGNVAAAAAKAGLPVIHISTDYVFTGDKSTAYVETDKTGPTGVYGASKLAGEQAVAAANFQHLIVRTAWVYSDTGSNFAKTMLRLAADRDEISVVSDQIGNPTSAAVLAQGLVNAASEMLGSKSFDAFGLYHLTGDGSTNWAGFARRILTASRESGGPWCEVKEIATSQYPTPAKRPANSRLSNEKFFTRFDWRAPAWQVSCDEVVRALVT